jgi:hypothetical protein
VAIREVPALSGSGLRIKNRESKIQQVAPTLALMWVVLRLLTSLAVGFARAFWRRRLKGTRQETPEGEWFLHHAKHKGRIVATNFGLHFPHPVLFYLTQESRLDRFFKAVGFSREIQSGDPAFDRAVYVSCDHPALGPVLQANPDVRAAILGLFHDGAKVIRADGEHLWAERRGAELPSPATLHRLAVVRDALQEVPAEHLSLLRDPFFWRALLVESVAWSMAIYAAPSLFEIATRSHPQYLNLAPVFKWGFLLGLSAFALLFFLARVLLRGSSRAHRVLTESGILLLFGVPLSSLQAVSDLNIALDRSPAFVATHTVASKYTRTTRSKSGTRTHYHLRFHPGEPGVFPVPPDLEVAGRVYHGTQPGAKVAFELRPGALKIPWVQDIRPVR